jgi:hypothetical protein
MENYESFDDYSAHQSIPHQIIISKLRKLVSELTPELEETVKWGNGSWVNGKLPVMYIHCKEDYVQFGFYGGSLLDDSNKLLQGNGAFVRHIRIESDKDIDIVKFEPLIKQASTLNYKS